MAEKKFEQFSQEEIEKAIARLQKEKVAAKAYAEKIKANPELKVKAQMAEKRRSMRNKLLLTKASAAGIQVTEKEIDDAIKALDKAKK